MAISQYQEITASDINSALSKISEKQDTLIGSIVWFSGEIANAPSNCLVCNGQTVSRETYARLFTVIGTKYGEGDGSTTFTLPDLSDGNGRFIRAGFTDSIIGTKEDDAIRNIKGLLNHLPGNANDGSNHSEGALKWVGIGKAPYASTVGSSSLYDASFDANTNYTGGYSTEYYNPMAGHASGDDIHPYDIYMLPLIVAY